MPGGRLDWSRATGKADRAHGRRTGGRIVTNPGGVLIRDGAGNLIGACGISGDTSDKDEMCAVAGIEAAGLKAEPGVD